MTVYTKVYMKVIMTFVTRLCKTNIMKHFGNLDFCISEFHIPKALFCGNINVVLYIIFELQG